MSFRWLNVIDGGGAPIPADQEGTAVDAAKNASTKSADSFIVQKTGLNVVANARYQFAFSYLYEDPDNPSLTITGPRSPNFTFTLQAPDLTRPVTNLVVTPGLLSYGVKWDLIDKALPDNKWLIDIQIYESLTGAFAGEEYLVWNGNGNSATILVSNTANRWIRVDTRDQDYHKKSVVSGPFKATDPIVVDITGPDNVSSVNTSGGLDTTGIVGFNGYANISWPAITGGGIRGYRIRFRPITTPASSYSYADSPGTGTSYRLAGLGAGLTYEIAIATYDEYNNTSSSYVAGSNVTVGGTPYIASTVDVTGFFRAKANPTDADSTAFKFGYGIETGKRGLAFNASNYWHIDSNQSALFKVGGPTSNYLLWDGSKLTVDGDINAKGGNFSGNIFMSTSGASIYNGTIDSATGNLTGNGFALNSTGLKVANGVNSVTIAAATGTITANAGSIGGWSLSGSTLSKNNVILDSTGQIQVGATAANSVYLKSSGDYVIWAGNNTPDANAKFRVHKDGTLYAVGAVFGAGSSIVGYGTTAQVTAAQTTATNAANTATSASTTANAAATAAATAKTAADAAKAIADAALPSASFNRDAIVNSINSTTTTTTINGGKITTGTISANAVVSDFISAFSINADKITAGMIKGIDIDISTDTSSGRFKTSYVRSGPVDSAGVTSTAINAVAFVSTTTSGWVTSCYPYWNGGADLGLGNFRWRRLMVGNGNYGVAADSYIDLGENTTRIFSNGRIFANTLGTGSGNSIVQDAGFLRVQTSSLRYKENIQEIGKDGYLGIINSLKPVTYNYIGDTGYNGGPRTLSGLIAEDLHEIPQLRTVVNYNEENQPDGIAYDRLTASLVLAIQEMSDKIDTLSSRIDALES
jgi:hypothetical protein